MDALLRLHTHRRAAGPIVGLDTDDDIARACAQNGSLTLGKANGGPNGTFEGGGRPISARPRGIADRSLPANYVRAMRDTMRTP